ncbi:MAG: hypothetical protein IT320_16385 [Anaerolineae bacterium]|nr:hypothetical protein [Anaerolineae bacterium]
MKTSRFKTDNPLLFGLSLLAGIGLITMILSLAYGVIAGADASTSSIGSFFVLGLVLFITGVLSWVAVVRPFENFDDINIPMDTGHGHTEPHEEHPALTETTEQGMEPVHH